VKLIEIEANDMSETPDESNAPQRFGLREYGVYRLPDGVEVIVCPAKDKVIPLLLVSDWDNFGEEAIRGDEHSTAFQIYHVDISGRVLRLSQPTKWNSYDLLDTGNNVIPRQ
jgi:hypothetical protein